MARTEQEIIGTKYGKLTIVRRATEEEKGGRKASYWYATCDCNGCGGPGFKIVNLSSMRKGYGTHCGCEDKKSDFTPLPEDFKPASGTTFKDLTGQVFDRLTVKKLVGKKNKEYVWECECSCPNHTIVNVQGVSLRSGRTKSCGCLKYESDHSSESKSFDDLTGKKFGHLTVLEKKDSSKYGQLSWLCECDCQDHTKLIVYGSNLTRGHTQSCGCDRRSHGEKAVAELLRSNNISFEQEYAPFKLASGNFARFDFYVDNKYFIEYDGETHFNATLHGWHTEERLTAQLERDAIKNQWCKENNIPLIRIPYTHLNNLCLEDLLLETSKFIIK